MSEANLSVDDVFNLATQYHKRGNYENAEVLYKKKRAYSEACDAATLEELIERCDVIVHAIAD